MKKHINSITDVTHSTFDQFFWFSGVVESISDPLAQGRVQVRCIGIHPENKTLVPTTDLPWAHVMLPTTSAGMSGIGATHGLVEGSWVIGFFSDGRSAQMPIVMGSVAGNPTPSSAQQDLIDNNQSLPTTATDGVAGLTQSTSLNNAGNILNSALGVIQAFGTPGINLTGLVDLLKTGVNPFNITKGTGPQTENILSSISTSNDLRTSQLTNAVRDNLRVQASPEEGRNIMSFLNKYSGDTNVQNSIFSDKTTPVSSSLNINPKSNTIDVQTNYASALDNSVTQAALISIEHNGIRKSQAVAPIGKYSNLDQYHFVISAQGQVFPKKNLSETTKKGDGLDTVSARGQTGNSLRICMIGGLPDDKKFDSTASFQERFTVPQFHAAIRLIRTLLKKYPTAVIEGGNSLINDGSVSTPGFDVSAMFKDILPKNTNISALGTPKILSTAATPTEALTNNEATAPAVYTNNKGFQDVRAIYPAINYGQDHNTMARYNQLSGAKRTPPIMEAIRGNITKFSLQEPRDASNRTSVSEIDPTPVKHVDWAGEYGMAHVIRETPGGHAIYADDTPGKNRMLIVSPTGSVIDMRPDGGIAIMSHSDFFNLTEGSLNTVSNGDNNEIVNGAKKVKIAGDFILEVGGKFSIHAKEINEYVVGDKNVLVDGTSKQQSKQGHHIEVGRDYSEEIGGNRQSVTSGTVIDQAGQSRSTTTTGTSSIKSNYVIDTTLGNRVTMTRGDSRTSTKGKSSNYAEGDKSEATSGNHSVTATGKVMQHSGGNQELNSGGLMSVIASGQMGISAASALSLDGASIKMQEGTLSESTAKTTLVPFEYPEKIQPIASMMNSETNPSSVDATKGPRQENEAHDEPENSGKNTDNDSGGTDSDTNTNQNSDAKSNLEPVSIGAAAGTACEVAKKFVARGMTEEAASAYTGAMAAESMFRTTATNKIGAFGLMQWTSDGGRKEYMKQWCGGDFSIDKQMDFIMHELRENPNGNAGQAAVTWKTSNLSDAIKSAASYERFNGWKSSQNDVFSGNEWGNRAGYAASVYKECFGKDPGKFNPVTDFDPNGLDTTKTNTSDSATDPSTASLNTEAGPEATTRGNEKNVDLPAMATKYVDKSQKISQYFTLNDLLRSGTHRFDLTPYIQTPRGSISADELVANLSKLATNVLDVIQAKLGRVTINSGFRPMTYNQGLSGAAKNSMHQYGKAADIVVAGHSPAAVARWVQNNIPAAHGIGRYRTFTHVDVRSGGRAMWGRN